MFGQLKTRSIKETHRYARHKMLFEERLGGEERRLIKIRNAKDSQEILITKIIGNRIRR